MCYAKNQVKLVVLGAGVVAFFGAFFAIFLQQIALGSEGLQAASVFVDKLTEDHNPFTPRVQVRCVGLAVTTSRVIII